MNISSAGHSFATQAYTKRAELSDAERPAADKSPRVSADKQEPTDVALTAEQVKEVEQLKARDREVRAHEMAHLAAAGGLAMSGATFTYQRGADGVSYAVGGEVKIDTSSGSTPEDTIRKAQTIRAAALAPAEPSGQDRAVAAQASQMEAQARAEQASQDRDDEEPANAAAESSQPTSESGQAAVQQYQSVATEFNNGGQLQLEA